MIFFEGRIGDIVSIDGKDAGPLPAKTTVTEGSHRFTVKGGGGDFSVTLKVVLAPEGQTTVLHLGQ
jgi:hypothetical protein